MLASHPIKAVGQLAVVVLRIHPPAVDELAQVVAAPQSLVSHQGAGQRRAQQKPQEHEDHDHRQQINPAEGGGVINVILGTLLIGTMLNGMTIMNMSYAAQNLVKGVVLLAAVIADSFLNPRNEETAQQGDI